MRAFVRNKYVRLKWADPALRESKAAEAAERAASRRAAAGTGGRSGKRAGAMASLSSDGV